MAEIYGQNITRIFYIDIWGKKVDLIRIIFGGQINNVW